MSGFGRWGRFLWRRNDGRRSAGEGVVGRTIHDLRHCPMSRLFQKFHCGSLTVRNTFSRAGAKAGGDGTFAPLPPFALGAFPQAAEVVLQAFEGAFHGAARIVEDGSSEQMSRTSSLISADENDPPMLRAMDAGGELQLDVACLAGTGDERNVAGKFVESSLMEQRKGVDEIRHDLLSLDDRYVHRRQQGSNPFLPRARADHQRAGFGNCAVHAGDADVAGQHVGPLCRKIVLRQAFVAMPHDTAGLQEFPKPHPI